jgi:hypothetical protein
MCLGTVPGSGEPVPAHNAFFPPAFAFFHRALATAASFAFAATDIRRLGFAAAGFPAPYKFVPDTASAPG